jgi:hypothetical protein
LILLASCSAKHRAGPRRAAEAVAWTKTAPFLDRQSLGWSPLPHPKISTRIGQEANLPSARYGSCSPSLKKLLGQREISLGGNQNKDRFVVIITHLPYLYGGIITASFYIFFFSFGCLGAISFYPMAHSGRPVVSMSVSFYLWLCLLFLWLL